MTRGTRIPVRRHVTLRARRARRLLTRPHVGISFFLLIEQRQRVWSELVRRHGTEREVYPEFDKLRARRLAEEAGVQTPALLDGPIPAAALDVERYGDEFVIKPNWGASARGILHVVREDAGWRNVLDGARFDDADAVRAAAARAVERSRRGDADDLLVEASVSGRERPVDWKVYTFWGEIGMILQIARTPDGPRGKHWSATWRDLGSLRRDVRVDPELPAPRRPHAILDAARRISLAVPTGFLRVDLYEQGDEVLAGEVALLPGGDQFHRRGLDRELGRMWLDANVRLLSARMPLIP